MSDVSSPEKMEVSEMHFTMRVLVLVPLLLAGACGGDVGEPALGVKSTGPTTAGSSTTIPGGDETATSTTEAEVSPGGGLALGPKGQSVPVAGTRPPVAVGSQGAAQPGTVAVTLRSRTYQEGTPIAVTVANGLDRPVYTEDQKSGCSVVTLERRRDDRWEPLTGCNSERAAKVMKIEPPSTVGVSIDPRSEHFGLAPDDPRPAFGAGTYRVVFVYRLQPDPEGESTLQAVSEDFVITA